MSAIKRIKQFVHADQISRAKDGSIIFRNGYFYRHGNTSDQFRNYVSASLNQRGIDHVVVDHGDHWTPFNGGSSLARSSHFYVRIVLKSDNRI